MTFAAFLPAMERRPFCLIKHSSGSGYFSYDGINWDTPGKNIDNIGVGIAMGTATEIITSAGSSSSTAYIPDDGLVTGNSDGTASWASPPYMTYGKGIYLIAHGTSSSSVSGDGKNWVAKAALPQGGPVIFGTSNFVNCSASIASTTSRSADGVTWGAGGALPVAQTVGAMATDGTRIIIVPQSGTANAITSNDGSTWSAGGALPTNQWYSLAYGNGIWCAPPGGGGSSINTGAYSTNNGTSWTAMTMPSTGFWISVTFFNGLFIAIQSGSNQYATSPDGHTWTGRTLPSSANWCAIAGIKGY